MLGLWTQTGVQGPGGCQVARWISRQRTRAFRRTESVGKQFCGRGEGMRYHVYALQKRPSPIRSWAKCCECNWTHPKTDNARDAQYHARKHSGETGHQTELSTLNTNLYITTPQPECVKCPTCNGNDLYIQTRNNRYYCPKCNKPVNYQDAVKQWTTYKSNTHRTRAQDAKARKSDGKPKTTSI